MEISPTDAYMIHQCIRFNVQYLLFVLIGAMYEDKQPFTLTFVFYTMQKVSRNEPSCPKATALTPIKRL